MRNLLKITAFWALTTFAQAQAPVTAPAAGETPPAAAAAASGTESVVLPPERRWRLGAAVGYGRRTNPLIQSDDIPVAIDLDIAYFGDRWFFDNGDLGIELLDNDLFTTNLVARVNSDRAFFSKTNTRYVTYSLMAGGLTTAVVSPTTGQPLTPAEAQPLKPPKRSYAVEAGFETLMSGEWGQAALHAFHDVSGTHEGYEIAADYSYRITRGRLSVTPSLGVSWKSAAMSDYYWGVHPEEASLTLSPYQARGGLGWQAGVRLNYYLTRQLRFALSTNYERLQYSVAQSPLVERDYVLAWFGGVAYQF